MKKLVVVIIMLLLGLPSFAQSTETGYVTVKWDAVEPCCTPMQYYVCITVMRVSDRVTIIEDLCELVSSSVLEYQFEFEFPCATPNEQFQVFASVKAGCEGPPLVECESGTNSGENASCADLTGGDFEMEVLLQ